MSTVWGNNYGCAKQYMCALDICLMNVLSSSYVIIIDCAMNSPGHVNDIVGGLNATDKLF